jgi:flagellar assembly protein FliH
MPTSNLLNSTEVFARRWSGPDLAPSTPQTARQIENVAAAARAEGFESGHAEGFGRGLDEARALAARLSAMVEQLSKPLAAADAEVERLVVGLAMQIGSQLALRELKTDPAAVAAIVHEAVRLLTPPPREVRVRLNPEDLAAVQSALDPGGPQWTAIPDAKLARGDCVVETEGATVDARMQSRVVEIARQLFAES